jgi:hypothetical protein
VEAPFAFRPSCDPTFLQQVPVDVRTRYRSSGRKEDPDKLAESTRVVVPHGLCISECLKDGVGLQDLPFEQTQTGVIGSIIDLFYFFALEAGRAW